MTFGTWKVLRFYKTGSLKTVPSKFWKYKLNLGAVQEVRWVKCGSHPAEQYTFFYRNRDDSHHLGTGFFVHKVIISAVKRAEFIDDRMSYITLRGHWCYVIYCSEYTCIN
jgi:hypothetical protein